MDNVSNGKQAPSTPRQPVAAPHRIILPTDSESPALLPESPEVQIVKDLSGPVALSPGRNIHVVRAGNKRVCLRFSLVCLRFSLQSDRPRILAEAWHTVGIRPARFVIQCIT